MHPCLSKFPNKAFYGGTLKDSSGVQRHLDEVKPGLSAVLHGIFAKHISSLTARKEYLDNAIDTQARLHYIAMPGHAKSFTESRSRKIQGHIEIFTNQIFPDLQTFFGSSMEEDVMLIVG